MILEIFVSLSYVHVGADFCFYLFFNLFGFSFQVLFEP